MCLKHNCAYTRDTIPHFCQELLLSAAKYLAPVMKKRATHLQMRIPSSQHRSSQECIQGFVCLDRHRRRLHHFSAQPVPVLHHPYCQEVLPHVYMERPKFITALYKAVLVGALISAAAACRPSEA